MLFPSDAASHLDTHILTTFSVPLERAQALVVVLEHTNHLSSHKSVSGLGPYLNLEHVVDQIEVYLRR